MNSISPDTVEYGKDGGDGGDGLYKGAPARKFREAISVCFDKYGAFSGRASRSEYWYFMLFVLCLVTIASTSSLVIFMSGVVSLPVIAVSFRRLHDIGCSGWWFGGWCLPVLILLLVVLVTFLAGYPVLQGGEDIKVNLMTDKIYNLYNRIIAGIFVNLNISNELKNWINQWFIFFPVGIYILYLIGLLILMCKKGSPKANKYG